VPYSSDKDVVGALCARQSELVHHAIILEYVFLLSMVFSYSSVQLSGKHVAEVRLI